MPSGACLTHLAFDSHHLGGPVYRLVFQSPPTEQDFSAIAAFVESQEPRLIFTRTPVDWAGSLEAGGFHEVERLLTLERILRAEDKAPLPPSIRLGRAGDGAAVAEIAGLSFTTDRYHRDPDIADRCADALKADWARNNVTGRADATFTALQGDRIVGFNTCLHSAEAAAIDLIAVHPDYRGRGIGKSLVDAAIAHYAAIADRLRVGTQSVNTGSRALYEGLGFTLAEEHVTFHLHGPISAESGS